MKDTKKTGTVSVQTVVATGTAQQSSNEGIGSVNLWDERIQTHVFIYGILEVGPRILSCKLQTLKQHHLPGQLIEGSSHTSD